jgi:hypothetical protein
MADTGSFPTVQTGSTAITRRYALVVVAESFAIAVLVRWGVVAVATEQARSQISGLQTILLGLALALVVGYMVAVIGVGVGMRNRDRGGLFTLVFALTALAVHIFAGVTQGIGMLAVPLPATTDFSALFLVPLLYTVPAAALRVIPWRWMLVIAAAGVMLASTLALVTR